MEYKDLYIEGTQDILVIKALSSPVRLGILELLAKESLNVQSLAKKMNLGKTTILTHLKILEESGLIRTEYISGTIGNQKICIKQYDRLLFNFTPDKEKEDKCFQYDIEVGNYFNVQVYSPCGLATKNNVIHRWDDSTVFFDKARVHASLLWFSYGYVEYKIPKKAIPLKKISEMKLSIEISTQGDIMNHKKLELPSPLSIDQFKKLDSDITFWINGMEVGTVTLNKYIKEEGGKYTPTWWTGCNHGKLINLTVMTDKSLVGEQVMEPHIGLDDVLDNDNDDISIRIGMKSDSENISGMTVYGRDFGNHQQDINIKFYE